MSLVLGALQHASLTGDIGALRGTGAAGGLGALEHAGIDGGLQGRGGMGALYIVTCMLGVLALG